ncbi:MAG: hypothetical protein CME16_00185 [Gemmatimonadetes bacterium]|nr:hypothetical protein [Gemmatimonadota bacterium]
MKNTIYRLSYPLIFAATLAACSTTEQQVEGLIEQLAANEIGSTAWNQAVDELIVIGRPAARQLIAHIAAGYYTGENYREYRDEIEKIRTGSARALGKIKPRAASAALVGTISSSFTDNERLAAIRAVGEIGFNQASVDAMKKELDKDPAEDEAPNIRLELAIALVKMDEERIASKVRAYIDDGTPELANLALEGLEGANYFGVPLLVDIATLEGPHQARAKTILENVKVQLLKQLDHEDPELRGHSARALGKINAPDVRDNLIALLEDESNAVCFKAATSLADMSQSEGINFLFSALEDQDPSLRANAVKYLVEVQNNSAAVEDKLIEALRHDNPLARSGAAQVLGLAHVEIALPALMKATGDDIAQVRWNAIIALGTLRSPASRERLHQLLEDEDDTVAYYAEWALLQLGQG